MTCDRCEQPRADLTPWVYEGMSPAADGQRHPGDPEPEQEES